MLCKQLYVMHILKYVRECTWW